ncbi:MAG: conjugal transfer protein TraX [Firmicutes bacterium]|nr:conjugal transfer protein TraX [Bacillota bacterium]
MDSAQSKGAVYEPPMQKKKGIPGSTVKIVAVVTMLIDHTAAVLLTRIVLARGYYAAMWDAERFLAWMKENWLLFYGMQVMRLIGRLGFPIFCFLLVEGFQKTRNVKKYIFRLGLFALISEIPFDLALTGRMWYFGYQNVYFTLLIGILTLWGFDALAKLKAEKWLRILLTAGGILLFPLCVALRLRAVVTGFLAGFFGAEIYGLERLIFCVIYAGLFVMLLSAWGIYRHKKGADSAWRMCGDLGVLAVTMMLATLLQTDYGGMGVLTIAVMYALRKNKVLSMTGGCVTLTVMSLSEITAFFALIPIARYNGERGLKMKYFFYIFYPAHLLILWLICYAMGIGGISAI